MAERPRSERTVRAVPRFMKSKRRLVDTVQEEVDLQVRALIENPLFGEPKMGALKGVRVVKFKAGVQQYLLAYQFLSKQNVIELLDVGGARKFLQRSPNVSFPAIGEIFFMVLFEMASLVETWLCGPAPRVQWRCKE